MRARGLCAPPALPPCSYTYPASFSTVVVWGIGFKYAWKIAQAVGNAVDKVKGWLKFE